MKTKTIIILLIAIIAVTIGIGFIEQNNSNNKLESKIEEAPVVDELSVYGLGLPPGKTITQEDVEKGLYPVEALEIAPNQYVIDTPRRIGRLARLDDNSDGIIDQEDPIYKHLAIAYINVNTKKIRFVSWQDAGITAMIYDPEHFTPEKSSETLPAGFWLVHNTLVLRDGSKWLSYHMPFPPSMLDQLTTEEGSPQQFVPPLH